MMLLKYTGFYPKFNMGPQFRGHRCGNFFIAKVRSRYPDDKSPLQYQALYQQSCTRILQLAFQRHVYESYSWRFIAMCTNAVVGVLAPCVRILQLAFQRHVYECCSWRFSAMCTNGVVGVLAPSVRILQFIHKRHRCLPQHHHMLH